MGALESMTIDAPPKDANTSEAIPTSALSRRPALAGMANLTTSILKPPDGATEAKPNWAKVRAANALGVTLTKQTRTRGSARRKASEMSSEATSTPLSSFAAAAPSGKKGLAGGSLHSLGRHGWMQAIVRIAILRYVLPAPASPLSRCTDCSEAIRRLLYEDCLPHLDAACRQDSNAFRSKHCYSDEMTKRLEADEESLRAIYTCFATEHSGTRGSSKGAASDLAANDSRLSLEELLEMCKSFNILDKDVTQKELTLAFVWSRPWVIDEHDYQSQRKLAGLSFQDFLEAFVRISMMKAWPSDAMLQAYGMAYPEQVPEFLAYLREADTRAFDAMLAERAVSWHQGPHVPDVECVRHLIGVCNHEIKLIGRKTGDGPVTLAHVRHFRKRLNAPDAPSRRG